MSNDERSVPDISISTAKPSKNPMGYTIIYHENGLTFSDGSTENEMLVLTKYQTDYLQDGTLIRLAQKG